METFPFGRKVFFRFPLLQQHLLNNACVLLFLCWQFIWLSRLSMNMISKMVYGEIGDFFSTQTDFSVAHEHIFNSENIRLLSRCIRSQNQIKSNSMQCNVMQSVPMDCNAIQSHRFVILWNVITIPTSNNPHTRWTIADELFEWLSQLCNPNNIQMYTKLTD